MAKRKKKRRKQKPTALASSWLADLLLAIASGVITAALLKALNFEKKEGPGNRLGPSFIIYRQFC